MCDIFTAIFISVAEDNREHKTKELPFQDTERLNHIHEILSKILNVIPM